MVRRAPQRQERSVGARDRGERAVALADGAVQEAFQTFLLLPQARSLVEEPRESASLLGVLVGNAARNMRRRRRGRAGRDGDSRGARARGERARGQVITF
jgi:hypothetical protein